ncbi:hypothetical protein MNBD_IGNAVI01-1905 [hydrothermal vent metagenome]|uniref:Uncharacterized protein n=1 Tax=hydrothermal vent metagenome TaxID=652676 RepID=A0A3B1C8I7_9ZZZZ
MLIKRKLIYALIALSIVLIIGNVLLERYSSDEVVIVQELSKNKIEEKFRTTLNDYGIAENWVTKISPKNKNYDSLDYIYKIKFPPDISIASFIKDVNASFVNQPVDIESVEKKNYSNSELKIFSNSILKLDANLIHSRKIKRIFAEYGFVIKIDDRVDVEVLNELSKLYINYTFAFVPSEYSSDVLDKLRSEYIVLINDEINDSRFELDEDFTKQRLINNIKEIIITYGRKVIYLIDENSKIYNSKIYSLIKDEFEKREIKILPLSYLTPLKADSKKQLVSLFQFYTTSLKGKKGETFLITYDDFITLVPLIERQLKMGDRVVKPKLDQ